MKRLAAVLALTALLAAAGTASAARTVGVQDLSQWTPNIPFGCSQLPTIIPGFFGIPSGGSTCTYFTTAVGVFDPAGSNIVPKGFGVITKIRVKTPDAAQGPMQVVTFRSIRQSNSTGFPGCCTAVSATPPFTPNRGGVTEVATRLPVMNATLLSQYLGSGDLVYDPPPGTPPPWSAVHEVPAGTQGIENYDAIGLTLLDPSTPIPATVVDDPNGPAGAAFLPPLATRQMRVDVVALNGVQVLLQGVWEPDADRDGLGDETQDPDGGHAPGAGTTPVTPPVTPTVLTVSAAPLTLPATGRLVGTRAAQVALTCAATAACRGVLRLLAPAKAAARAAAAAKAKPKRKPTVYGRATFTIPAGATLAVTVRLGRAAKRALRRRAALPVTATATVGGKVVTKKLTLRRGR